MRISVTKGASHYITPHLLTPPLDPEIIPVWHHKGCLNSFNTFNTEGGLRSEDTINVSFVKFLSNPYRSFFLVI